VYVFVISSNFFLTDLRKKFILSYFERILMNYIFILFNFYYCSALILLSLNSSVSLILYYYSKVSNNHFFIIVKCTWRFYSLTIRIENREEPYLKRNFHNADNIRSIFIHYFLKSERSISMQDFSTENFQPSKISFLLFGCIRFIESYLCYP